MPFDPVDPKQSFPSLEKGILQYWKEEDIFKRSMHQRENAETFCFFDGPPFATGLPHYGHLLAGTIKDVIPRYQTMRGKHVQRRFGWDCHGLPIENIIEKEHNINSKQDIEEMGIEKFNNLCRSAVMRCADDWRTVVERMGRFVDMDWDYKTMDPDYMESIWWVFGELYKKEMIYEGLKPMHICPRCATPLSNFEVTQGYSDRTDQSVIMTFPLQDDPDTILLAWTTTPWSLPGNTWLAVGEHITYATVKEGGKTYILAEKLVEKVFKDREYEVVGTVEPKELAGKRYEPLFPYFVDKVIPRTEKAGNPQTYGERVFTVVMYDDVEVSDEEGTGIVHVTSCLGEDSYAVSVKEDVDVIHHVQIDGYFSPEVSDFQGVHVKPEGDDPMATDKLVITYLQDHNRYFSHFTISHSYPHCWRCDTPLLPYTTSSWFVTVEKMKEKLLKNNSETKWVPSHIRDGRFGKWLEGARDWAISRNRYWGTPLPIWRSDDGKVIDVITSRDQLMEKVPGRFTKLTVLRHGESEGNLIPIYQGEVPGTDLTAEGKKQATDTGKLIAEKSPLSRPAVIYASPLARTQQTAEAVAKSFDDVEVVVDERVREVRFGDYEGKVGDFSELGFLKERRAHKLDTRQPESIYHFDGMETWDQTQERVSDFLEDVLEKHRGKHIIVVTHADPLRNVEHFFTKEDPFKLSHRPYPPFAAYNTFYWDHEKNQQMDLHKDTTDDLTWPAGGEDNGSIAIIRHGETNYNAEKRVQGHQESVLTEKGKEQIRDAAKSLNASDYDFIVASDLKRTRETADILAEELGLPIQEHTELFRERSAGDYEGMLRSEVKEIKDESFAMSDYRPPNGETREQFIERIDKGLDYVRETYGDKRVLVVAHGGVILVAKYLNGTYKPGVHVQNGEVYNVPAGNMMRAIGDVFDCWFESGSMPYAEAHFPFDNNEDGKPKRFPADFIAESLDQTRGWFYTLMVLSTALFDKPAFWNCICGGMILAEDGKKMSKRLKNYPDPTELMDEHGADALRFTLMSSPVVRAQELRFSEKPVAETVRSVLLPLWNSYSFFVTYANAAGYEPAETRVHSTHPLDVWIRAEVQDLVNRMTEELDSYDLTATCSQLDETIDMLTNWYIRLSRRRFAGKASIDAVDSASTDEDQLAALHTLYDVLLTFSQLLAPFCPYISDAIYLNLVKEQHSSIHLTDWPEPRPLKKEEEALLAKTRYMRTIVSLGHKVRRTANVKTRQPLSKATVAAPPKMKEQITLSDEDMRLLLQELNVKHIDFTDTPEELAEVFVNVDARKVGPRLGKRVQEIIGAGKQGQFTENPDGSITILDQTLAPEEAEIVYRGKEDMAVAAERGIVVGFDTNLTEELEMEGIARDVIRAVQKLRKEQGYDMNDQVVLGVKDEGALVQKALKKYENLIQEETKSIFGERTGKRHTCDVGNDAQVTIFLDTKK